jgi:cellulose synthase/poly-beta-1,6-N-acetylglucosamine synthase-like glycosyltransferase
MPAAPFFSVVIPLYNKRPYIRRAVDSVLAQTFEVFELIVVDDGSTDGSHEALAHVTDPRFRLLRQENCGVGPARNAGMAAARGAWFAFLDGDDMWLPDHLLELRRIIDQEPAARMISCRSREVVEHRLGSMVRPSGASIICRIDYFREAARDIGFMNSSSTAVGREVFGAIGGFANHRSGEDLEYWARIALRCPVAISNRLTVLYFRDTGGNMVTIARERKPNAVPLTHLRQLSPSVSMLCDAAEREPTLLRKPAIREYVNSRVLSAIRGALYRGDLERARQAAALALQPVGMKLRCMSWTLALPNGLVDSGLSLYTKARSA